MSLAATIKVIKEGGQLAVENIPYLKQVPRELLNLGSEVSKRGGPGAVARKQNIPNIKIEHKKNNSEGAQKTIRVANEIIDIYNNRGINIDRKVLAKALGYNKKTFNSPFYTKILKPINTKEMNVIKSFKKIMEDMVLTNTGNGNNLVYLKNMIEK